MVSVVGFEIMGVGSGSRCAKCIEGRHRQCDRFPSFPATGKSWQKSPTSAGCSPPIALAFMGTTASRQVLEKIDDSRFRNWTR